LIAFHNQEACDLIVVDATSLHDFAQERALNFIEVIHKKPPSAPRRQSTDEGGIDENTRLFTMRMYSRANWEAAAMGCKNVIHNLAVSARVQL
jgi:hypothetical protein